MINAGVDGSANESGFGIRDGIRDGVNVELSVGDVISVLEMLNLLKANSDKYIDIQYCIATLLFKVNITIDFMLNLETEDQYCLFIFFLFGPSLSYI